jgi:hypothetical protein
VRLAARLTGWKIDIKNASEYDQSAEDAVVSELIAQRQEEEALQAEVEARLEIEQAARAEEDARLRELYPLPEDDEELGEEGIPSFFDLALREQKAINFTIHELIRDLSHLSEKLKVIRYEIKSPNSSFASEKARALQLKLSAGPHEQNEFFAQINHLEKRGENPFGSHIYLDLMLTE